MTFNPLHLLIVVAVLLILTLIVRSRRGGPGDT